MTKLFSLPSCFISKERAPGSHWMGDWVDRTAYSVCQLCVNNNYTKIFVCYSGLQNIVLKIKDGMMNNVLNCDSYIIIILKIKTC
jgi:hypothetical protein